MKRIVIVGACALALAVLVGWSRRAPGTAQGAGMPAPSTIAAPQARAGNALAIGRSIVQAKWGSDPAELGRKHEEESNPEGPMAIAAAGGEVLVVDQVNRRVQRYRDGKLVGSIPIGSDTVQDLAAMRGGRTALLDRLNDGNVQVWGKDGKLANTIPLVGKGMSDGGDATGVFADDTGVYVEREHGSLVRVADGDGNADADRPELPGRPSRDGRYALQVEIADPGAGQLLVRATDRTTGATAWTQTVQADASIVHVVLLDSDRGGNVYVAAEVGRESTDPPYDVQGVHTIVARLGSTGVPRGQLRLPALLSADETFRPLSVDDGGALYLMVAGDDGMQVVRYTFP